MYIHRVDRVLGFISSCPNWDSPNPVTRKRVCSPLLWLGGGGGAQHTRLRERGWGVAIPTKGQTLWCSRYICTLWYIFKSTDNRAVYALRYTCMCNCYVTLLNCYKKEIFIMRESLRNQKFMQSQKIIYSYCSFFTKRKSKYELVPFSKNLNKNKPWKSAASWFSVRLYCWQCAALWFSAPCHCLQCAASWFSAPSHCLQCAASWLSATSHRWQCAASWFSTPSHCLQCAASWFSAPSQCLQFMASWFSTPSHYLQCAASWFSAPSYCWQCAASWLNASAHCWQCADSWFSATSHRWQCTASWFSTPSYCWNFPASWFCAPSHC
jgi:hypothetical protein